MSQDEADSALVAAILSGTQHARLDGAVAVAGSRADAVTSVCPRCAAGMSAYREEKRWQRIDPQP